MGFIKLDEMTDEHPKVLAAIDAAGEAAAWLWLRSICYCARAYTDGFVPKAKVVELARAKDVKRKTSALLTAGLWEEAPTGYLVHDFLDHNVSASERKASRQRNADRVAKHRSRNDDVTALQKRDGNGDVTPKSVRSNAPIEVEVEVELPPLPPQGGRERDKGDYEDALKRWASAHFPSAHANHVGALVAWLRNRDVEPTPENMRAYAAEFPQWSPGIVEVAA